MMIDISIKRCSIGLPNEGYSYGTCNLIPEEHDGATAATNVIARGPGAIPLIICAGTAANLGGLLIEPIACASGAIADGLDCKKHVATNCSGSL
ncbi:MAG: hypothetical protein OXF84_08155 [Bacteroidetes bacterium]|nr:hypothetical protein [Bacteroidota bacterium]